MPCTRDSLALGRERRPGGEKCRGLDLERAFTGYSDAQPLMLQSFEAYNVAFQMNITKMFSVAFFVAEKMERLNW
eukprot:CAMPEP_0113941396 /NCGR_PEP_ID=MMETSP1339-20121228/7314_1 /TAXON_ID=94617 /ORGANISM="Fibrocapsa japonica" /LENGTH=74 /DNA_ID=CAMNT_0000945527 /DNA_START=553 /DNA_END=777 /DNA_ORIENTATION=- /assembly_acc=CAM_ASM_000762